MNTDDLRQLIREEVRSASQDVLKDLIQNDDFRAIMKQEIKEAVSSEFGTRLEQLDSAVKS